MNENILNNFYCWDFLSNIIKFCSILEFKDFNIKNNIERLRKICSGISDFEFLPL
ncbi:hypothetical protein [Borreliella garinii]|uniref:hypothetical protein n=1 Tax=Borreliella garinii TaxID=29519 RepID=UPI00040680DE|nr:hypothetical protein [Borreliella garinii]